MENFESYFPDNIRKALKNDPPGSWMPALPDKCIRLSSGYPDPKLVPSMELKDAVGRLIDEEADLPLHYIGSPRIPKLKKQIRQRMAERGMNTADSDVLITSGACQAIDLIARVFLDEKKVAAVESPTYMEALEIFRNYTRQIISIPVDGAGLRTDLLETLLAGRKSAGLEQPRFLYTIPTFQNPTGTTMPAERRKHLLKLAAEYDFFILEDDAYGELSFHESPVPLKAMDGGERVLYIGSLSKITAPGMRVGWIAGPSGLIKGIEWFKKDLDHPFAQSAMAAYLETVNLQERLGKLRGTYKAKCAAMISALEQYLPESVSWHVPEGGYFVWAKIPGTDTSVLLQKALAEGVSFIPGKYFFPDQEKGAEFLRLSFSYADEEEIVEGIRLLGKVIHSM